MNLIHKQAITLTELIVAVALLATVMLTATTVEIASHNFYKETDKYSQTQLDISPAMELISKTIMQGIGKLNDSAIEILDPGPTNGAITIRIDSNKNGRIDLNDDKKAKFELQGNIIKYYPDITIPGTVQEIARKVKYLTFSTIPPGDPNNFCIKVTITARFVPTSASGPDNPEVTLETAVSSRSVSLN